MSRPDIDDAVSRMPKNFAVNGLIKKLPDEIRDDETVIEVANGTYSDKPALLVLTSKRILFVGKWMFQKHTEDFPLSRISSVELKSGMLMSEIIIYASNQEAKIKHLAKPEAKQFADKARELIAAGDSPPASAAPAVDGPAEQLLKLKQLHDAGVLSDAEYEQKRQALVSLL